MKKANKEELDRIMKLREAYAQLSKEIQDRLTKAEIANAEGLEKLLLENEFTKEQINLLEEKARAAAKASRTTPKKALACSPIKHNGPRGHVDLSRRRTSFLHNLIPKTHG